MARVAGIIHPGAFQIRELMGSMALVFGASSFQTKRYKNFECGAWNQEIFEDKHTHITLLFDGEIQAAEVAKLYSTEGEAFVKKIPGGFALALFDHKRETLYLARDCLGKRSLYFGTFGNYFLFASEIKGLLATGIVPQTPSLQGLSAYLSLGYIPQDLSPIKGVSKLLPGYLLKVNLHRHYSISQFASLSAAMSPPKQASFSMPAISTPKIESPFDLSRDLVKMVWELDEPQANLDVLSLWEIAKASRGQQVDLTIGQEELLGSYARYFDVPENKSMNFRSLLPLLRLFKLPYKWKVLRRIDVSQTHLAYLSKVSLFNDRARKKVAPALFPYFNSEVFLERFYRLKNISDTPKSLTYFDLKTEIPDFKLQTASRLFTYFNASYRTPFLESPLFELLAARPLDESNAKITSRSVFIPYTTALFKRLLKGKLVDEGFISPKWIRHQLGFPYLVEENFRQLWALLVLEIWFRLYIDLPVRSTNAYMRIDELFRS